MIYVITHKKFDDSIVDSNGYQILHVGKNDNCKENYLRDDTGDNISEKNSCFCELTGLYWIWKNSLQDDEITGLVHYRRYFTDNQQYHNYAKKGIMPSPLDYSSICELIDEKTVVLPCAYKTLSTLRNSYRRCHDIQDLEVLENVLNELQSEYIKTFRNILKKHKGYYFNMVLCNGKTLKEYCSWLFPILYKVEESLKYEKGSNYQNRVYGFLSERLLQVWIIHNGYKIVEMPVFNVEQRPITLRKRNSDRIGYLVDKYIKHKRK